MSGIKPAGSGMRTLSRPTAPEQASTQGGLLADRIVPEEVAGMTHRAIGAAAPPNTVGLIDVSAVATHSMAVSDATVRADGHLATDFTPASSSVNPHGYAPGAAARAAGPHVFQPGGANPSASGDYEIAVDLATATDSGTPTCLVPRNTPTDQVLQPTPAMAQWAVDQAVHGDLTVQRPANYLSTGQAAYEPQTMFPPVALSGPISGTIPAQVQLGILAQESNFKQASWHAVAGDGGNPLVADYYGTFQATSIADNPNVVPNYSQTDCGYGIGQVTDGMSSIKPNPMSTANATAVATDYAANIAASARILGQTWNQLATMSPPVLLNGGDPKYIENWFLAIWGYNSGVHLQSDAGSNGGHYGVGWLNNPANPNYLPTRKPFLDNISYSNDAAHPQAWSYEEKVMGWVTHPQVSGSTAEYSAPTFGTSVTDPNSSTTHPLPTPTVNIPENTSTSPNFFTFCSTSVNACSPSAPTNPCPSDDSSCWWSKPVSWISSIGAATAATEHLSYSLGSAEPAISAQYPNDCPNKTTFYSQFAQGAYVVTDLANPNGNVRGCSWATASDGKFTIRLGDNISIGANQGSVMQANPLSAQIDLHQIGAGFLGHFYFTHTYDSGSSTVGGNQIDGVPSANTHLDNDNWIGGNYVAAQVQHRVVGTWTPRILSGSGTQKYAIAVSVPDHGANAPAVTYRIDLGMINAQPIGSPASCKISQASNGNRWVYLGSYTLAPSADVWLSNMVPGATGSNDVAFGAVVFVPTSTDVTCGAAANIVG